MNEGLKWSDTAGSFFRERRTGSSGTVRERSERGEHSFSNHAVLRRRGGKARHIPCFPDNAERRQLLSGKGPSGINSASGLISRQALSRFRLRKCVSSAFRRSHALVPPDSVRSAFRLCGRTLRQVSGSPPSPKEASHSKLRISSIRRVMVTASDARSVFSVFPRTASRKCSSSITKALFSALPISMTR